MEEILFSLLVTFSILWWVLYLFSPKEEEEDIFIMEILLSNGTVFHIEQWAQIEYENTYISYKYKELDYKIMRNNIIYIRNIYVEKN